MPLIEIDARIPVAVAERAAAWMKRNGHASLFSEAEHAGYLALGSPGLKTSYRLPGLSEDCFGALCAGAPDQAIAILKALVRQVPYEAGAPSSERPAMIARLERGLATLEAEEEAAVDQAAAAGVTIAHRAEVIDRRQHEACERERGEEQTRSRQQALEAAHQRRG